MVKDYNIEVEWKAFELRPEGVKQPPKPPGYIEQAKTNVERMSEHYGIEMKWNDRSEHSRMALKGAKYAEEQGFGNAYHDAVFRAHFQEEKTIDDQETLIEIATTVGLEEESFRRAINSRKYEQKVLEETQEAQQLGITGIPCFVAGNNGIMGAQSYEALVRLIKEEE